MWEFQDYYLELWIEKDALVRLFKDIAQKYQLLLFPSRGYTSLTKIHNAINRFEEKTHKGKKCVVLYFGDLDPSGWDIYRNIKERLKNQAEVIRVMLNPDQKEIYNNLVPMPLKPKDARSKKFKQNHELEHCYELDAVDPGLILKYTEENIKNFFNPQKAPDTSQWYELFEKTKKSIEKYIYDIEKLSN